MQLGSVSRGSELVCKFGHPDLSAPTHPPKKEHDWTPKMPIYLKMLPFLPQWWFSGTSSYMGDPLSTSMIPPICQNRSIICWVHVMFQVSSQASCDLSQVFNSKQVLGLWFFMSLHVPLLLRNTISCSTLTCRCVCWPNIRWLNLLIHE